MDFPAQVRAWTYERQRLSRTAGSPLEALRSVVAVYATHPTAPLSLWARASSFSPARYRGLDARRSALRIPGMRGTMFLVPRGLASTVFTAVRPSPSRITRSLGRHGLSAEEYERLAARILPAAREPVRSEDLRQVAGLDGPALGTVLRCLRYEGRLLALAGESLSQSAHRYVTTSTWSPEGLDAGDPGAALAGLAGAYLAAYGPARAEDFRWWAGVGKRAAAAALEVHDTVDLGDGLLLRSADEEGFHRVRALRGVVDLLPRWDPYTMGHAPDGRARFVHPDVQERVYTPIGVGLPGDGNPVVLLDGHAVATWTFTLQDGPDVQPFDRLGPTVRRKVDAMLMEVAGLLRA